MRCIYKNYFPDMIATMGEATGERALQYMRDKMLQSEEGSQILK